MSLDANLRTEVKYKRVAEYFSRIGMVELGTDHIGRGLARTDEFTDAYKKELALCHFINLTNTEWEKIQGAMIKYVDESRWSPAWKVRRIEWVRALDTLRAFQ